MTGKRRRLLMVAFSCVLLAATAALSSPLYEWKNYYPQHSSPAEAKMLKADRYFNAVETEAAQKTYTEAIAIDPKFAPAYGNRAKTWLELGKNKEAFKDLDEAISCANKLYRRLALRDRAELHKALKEYVAAERDYKELLATGQPTDGILAAHAECNLALNKPKDALVDLNKVRPDAPYIWKTRLEAFIMLKDYDRALAECNTKLSSKKPMGNEGFSNAPMYEERAHIYDCMGKHDLASKDRQTAKQLESQDLDEMPFMSRKRISGSH